MDKRVRKKPIYKNIYFHILIGLVVILGGFFGYTLAIKNITDKWNDKIYSGIRVEDIDLTAMTKEEAYNILNDNYGDVLNNKKINFIVNNKTYEYTYKDIDGKYNIDEIVDKAFDFGRDKNIFKKYSLIKNKDNETYTINLKFQCDEDKLNNVKEEVYKNSIVKEKNADLNIVSGKIQVISDVIGYEMDKDDFDKKINDFIENDAGKDVNINLDVKETKAAITKDDLSKVNSKMSTFSTTYAVGERGKNLELAASLVNGTILMPGDTFSYDEVSQKGRGRYTLAGGYINGKVEQVEAGGICQVSTALYRAVMRANIKSVERHNHMMPVGYSKLGLDATVAWGYLDYKFTNTYDFPIYIEGISGGGNVTFNIYGDVSALNGNTYDLTAEYLGTDSQGNYKAKSYLVTYKDGKEINREYIATDTYKPESSN